MRRTSGGLVLLLALAASPVNGGGNLNHYHDFVAIRGWPNDRLFQYFRDLQQPPSSLDPSISGILFNGSSKRLRLACREMVNMWGTEIRGTGQMIPRVVRRLRTPQRQFLLTYTCFSTSSAVEARYNDQRVALLTVDSTESLIATIPHGEECMDCTELSQIQSLEELTIGGMPGVRMELVTTSDNPCCGGADSFREERVVYYVVDDRDLRMAASVATAREEVLGDDEQGDSTARFRGELTQKLDSTGGVTGFELTGVLTQDSARVTQRQVRYTWNADSLRFLADTLR